MIYTRSIFYLSEETNGLVQRPVLLRGAAGAFQRYTGQVDQLVRFAISKKNQNGLIILFPPHLTSKLTHRGKWSGRGTA